MNEKDLSSDNLNSLLILRNEISIDNNIHFKRLQIINIIKKKYLINLQSSLLKSKITRDKNFLYITNAKKEIYKDVKKKISLIKETIFNQETELEKLYTEKKLLNDKKIQSEIIKNQQELIDNYKQTIKGFKNDLTNKDKQLVELKTSNRNFLVNNTELKNIITRFIKHNKNLQNDINKLKQNQSDSLMYKSSTEEISNQIKLYQEDNIRLSNEIINIQKKYETTKNNLTSSEQAKEDIFILIKDLNNSLTKTNIIGTPYVKKIVTEQSINSKILNDITIENLKDVKFKTEVTKNLNDKIKNIFESS